MAPLVTPFWETLPGITSTASDGPRKAPSRLQVEARADLVRECGGTSLPTPTPLIRMNSREYVYPRMPHVVENGGASPSISLFVSRWGYAGYWACCGASDAHASNGLVLSDLSGYTAFAGLRATV